MTCSVCGRSVSFDERVGYLHTVAPSLLGVAWHLALVVPALELHPANGERAA